VLLALLAGCAVEHAQTDLVALARRDRAALRGAIDVTVVSYPSLPFTFNGRADERATAFLAAAPAEPPLGRVRDGVLARLTGDLGFANLVRRTELTLERDEPAALRDAVTSPLVLDFRTTSWGIGNLRGGGEPRGGDPFYVHHFVRARLVRVADGEILWRAVCGLRGYPGDSSATLDALRAAGGTLLREKLQAAADGCVRELVGFFQGAD
jgi:hypothetical protein